MTASELEVAIRKLRPLFLEGVGLQVVREVLAGARQQHFLTNSIITNQGHPANHLYMLLNGGARSFFLTQAGHKMQVHTYPPGDMFGGRAILSEPSDYLVSTEAVKDSHTLVWDRATSRRLVERYSKLLDNALLIASSYLDLSIATNVALSCQTARQRLAEVLVGLASGAGHRVSGGIEVAVSNEELAAAANVTPFTVSRLMSEWQRSGTLSKSRGKVLLSSPERLLLQDL